MHIQQINLRDRRRLALHPIFMATTDDVDNLFVVLSFCDKKGDLLMFG